MEIISFQNFKTHPILALMRNPPPINRNSLPTLLRPRPLDRQIRITHQGLPDVIEAMVNMILLRLEQILISIARSVEVHARFECEEKSANVVQAVQLVEDGDVVDRSFAFFCRLAWWERIVFWVGDENESVSGRCQVVAPGFVSFGC